MKNNGEKKYKLEQEIWKKQIENLEIVRISGNVNPFKKITGEIVTWILFLKD